MMDGAIFAKLVQPSGKGMPYPEVPPSREKVLVTAFEEAWKQLQACHSVKLRELDEDQTTTLLEQQLLQLLNNESVAGFNPEFFAVTRDSKVVNFDGRHPDKMPDLVIGLNRTSPGLPSDYALHVECKPVNARAKMSPYYGRNGMGCFIGGDYGCRMRSGLMIAYAEKGYTFKKKVLPKLKKSIAKGVADPLATTQLSAGSPIASSHHLRNWKYVNGQEPGEIRLLHVWLTVP